MLHPRKSVGKLPALCGVIEEEQGVFVRAYRKILFSNLRHIRISWLEKGKQVALQPFKGNVVKQDHTSTPIVRSRKEEAKACRIRKIRAKRIEAPPGIRPLK